MEYTYGCHDDSNAKRKKEIINLNKIATTKSARLSHHVPDSSKF